MAAWLAGLAGLWFGARQGLKGSPKFTFFAGLVFLMALFLLFEIPTALALKDMPQRQDAGIEAGFYVPLMLTLLVGLGIAAIPLLIALRCGWSARDWRVPFPWSRLRRLILGAVLVLLTMPVCATVLALWRNEPASDILTSVPSLLIFTFPAVLLFCHAAAQEKQQESQGK